MKLLIPEEVLRERLLPYAATLHSININEDMIYNIASIVLGYCVELNNFSSDFIFDKTTTTCWEVLGEVTMEVFGETEDSHCEYNVVETKINLCISAVYEICLQLKFYLNSSAMIKQHIDTFKTRDPFITVDNDKYDNVIISIDDARTAMENADFAKGRL